MMTNDMTKTSNRHFLALCCGNFGIKAFVKLKKMPKKFSISNYKFRRLGFMKLTPGSESVKIDKTI